MRCFVFATSIIQHNPHCGRGLLQLSRVIPKITYLDTAVNVKAQKNLCMGIGKIIEDEESMSKIDENSLKLLQEKNFAFLATVDANGRPQVTPIWVDTDGDHVILNTAIGRVKQKNTQRDPRVAVAVLDMSNPYRFAAVRGRVVEQIPGQAAEDHIDKLAKKYLGKDKYPFRQVGEKRVILKIRPEHVTPPQ